MTVDARVGNVFDELRGLERLGERFDTIVLDPPAFAKSKAAVAKATAGYKEINLRALKLLNPGGTLVTCSCSYNVNEAMFAEIVYDASVDAQVHVTVVEKRMQGRDHPVLSGRAGDLLSEVPDSQKDRVMRTRWRSVAPWLLASAFYAALTIVQTWPLVTQLSRVPRTISTTRALTPGS